MFSFRSHSVAILLTAIVLTFSAVPAMARVEAVKGKRYTLNKNHGPWMIMAAIISGVPEERRTEGMTPWEAADQLVYELRKHGIPAYTMFMGREMGEVSSFSAKSSGKEKQKYIARHEGIAILAGNFSSEKDKQAKLIMNWMKKEFQPSFAKNKKSGAILARTPGRPNPLSRAHLTPNPLMSASELKRRSVDPLLQKLNVGEEFSLTKNKGKYSLRVATFRGTSITQVGGQMSDKAQNHFEKMFGNNLDKSGTDAWELTQALRSARRYGYPQNYEAYLFHDRYESYVCIGSFSSENDPRIVELAKMFKAKPAVHQGRDRERAEVFSIPRQVPVGSTPEKLWMFDMMPKLVRVP